MEIWSHYLVLALIYASLVLSLNLVLGYAGQLTAGHAGFAAVGGYAVGLLTGVHGWSFFPAVLVGMVVAAVIGGLVAFPAMKLSPPYLLLLTLGVANVLIGLFTTIPTLGGSSGIISLPPVELFGWRWTNPSDWLVPSIVATGFVYIVCHVLGESPYGRVLRSLREDDVATEALGKHVLWFKVSVFAVTSGLAALSGGLLSGYLRAATPSLFGFTVGLGIIAMVIIGGLGNLTGSVIGAVALSMLDPLLHRVVGMSPDRAGFVRFIVYGVALVVVMRVRPQGLLPERAARPRRRPEAAAAEVVALAPAPVADTATRRARWEAAPVVVEVHGLSRRFGPIVAADDLSLTLRAGTVAALVGPNGAGKTTLFNLLTGRLASDRGEVRLNGRDVSGQSPHRIAVAGMVRSFQDVRLFERMTCIDNVAVGVPGQPGERLRTLAVTRRARAGERATVADARRWLDFVGLGALADAPAGSLSFGQAKLVAFARVLATGADVLLLDEPCSGIDAAWVDTMLALVDRARAEGRTICLVEHNLDVVSRLADYAYFMELGRITAEGPIDELTASPRLAEAYFGVA